MITKSGELNFKTVTHLAEKSSENPISVQQMTENYIEIDNDQQ